MTTTDEVKQKLEKALQGILVAAKHMQTAIDTGDVEDAMDWLDVVSSDATAALNEIHLEKD